LAPKGALKEKRREEGEIPLLRLLIYVPPLIGFTIKSMYSG
jgi:hypothetical protein